MTDVLFYQNYTYVADISAIVLCIICWLLLHSSYAVREKSLVIFKAGPDATAAAARGNAAANILLDCVS